jgi:hypothetical protein
MKQKTPKTKERSKDLTTRYKDQIKTLTERIESLEQTIESNRKSAILVEHCNKVSMSRLRDEIHRMQSRASDRENHISMLYKLEPKLMEMSTNPFDEEDAIPF